MSAEPTDEHEHLKWRIEQRLAGKMNAPIKRRRPKLSDLPPSMRIMRHELECECSECRPQHVVDFIASLSPYAGAAPDSNLQQFVRDQTGQCPCCGRQLEEHFTP